MNSNTKIWVIPKNLIIAAAIAVLTVILGIAVFLIFSTDKSSQDDSAPASAAGSSNIFEPSADKTSVTYVPGVYTSSISLDNTPMSVKVTVDADHINSIDLVYTDETVTTMYPMLGSCFNELAKEVCDKGSVKNVTYSAENRYTAAVILKGIENALAKAAVK